MQYLRNIYKNFSFSTALNRQSAKKGKKYHYSGIFTKHLHSPFFPNAVFVCLPRSLTAASLRFVVANYAFIASVQARKLIRLVAPPLPKKSVDFSGTHVIAKSYPVRTAIQLSRIAIPSSSLDKGVPKVNLIGEKVSSPY